MPEWVTWLVDNHWVTWLNVYGLIVATVVTVVTVVLVTIGVFILLGER